MDPTMSAAFEAGSGVSPTALKLTVQLIASGVILMREQRNSTTPAVAEVIRRAIPAKDAHRLTPSEVVDIARLANLRMWEAYKKVEDTKERIAA